ncbi:MAG: carboxypeptidase regulatory-like domain-containing protein, partial [Gammaproteobacteria bacterium]
ASGPPFSCDFSTTRLEALLQPFNVSHVFEPGHQLVSCILLIFVMFGIIACGGGGGSSAGGGGSSGGGNNTGTLTVNVYDMLGNPVGGALVTLDNLSGPSATTNASGQAVFNVSGSHDVHVQKVGFVATSALGAAVSSINIPLQALGKSYVNFQGSVSNSNSAPTMLLRTATGPFWGTGIGNPNFLASINFGGIPAGSNISGTLWALESTFDFVSLSTVVTDAVNLGPATYTTVLDTYSATQTVNPAFNATKPNQTTITTISGLTLPPGANAVSVAAGEADVFGNILPLSQALGVTPPLTLSAYDPFGLTNIDIQVVAVTPALGGWMKWERLPKGSTANITANMTTLPAISAGQSGATINFTPSSDAGVTAESLAIMDNITGNPIWLLFMPAGQSSVTLPALGILTVGTTYKIGAVSHMIPGMTYDQLLTSPPATFNIPAENGFSPEVSFTR